MPTRDTVVGFLQFLGMVMAAILMFVLALMTLPLLFHLMSWWDRWLTVHMGPA